MSPFTFSIALLFCARAAPDDELWGSYRGSAGKGLSSSSKLPAALDPECTLIGRTEVPNDDSSPLFGDGKIDLAGISGVVTVVRAGKEWVELAAHGLNEPIWATPALRESSVIVRTDAAHSPVSPRDRE